MSSDGDGSGHLPCPRYRLLGPSGEQYITNPIGSKQAGGAPTPLRSDREQVALRSSRQAGARPRAWASRAAVGASHGTASGVLASLGATEVVAGGLGPSNVGAGGLLFVVGDAPVAAAGEEEAGESRKLFVGGIPVAAQEPELRAHFTRFGEVRSVIVMRDRETGHGRMFGFVDFEDEAAAAAALGHGDRPRHFLCGGVLKGFWASTGTVPRLIPPPLPHHVHPHVSGGCHLALQLDPELHLGTPSVAACRLRASCAGARRSSSCMLASSRISLGWRPTSPPRASARVTSPPMAILSESLHGGGLQRG